MKNLRDLKDLTIQRGLEMKDLRDLKDLTIHDVQPPGSLISLRSSSEVRIQPMSDPRCTTRWSSRWWATGGGCIVLFILYYSHV